MKLGRKRTTVIIFCILAIVVATLLVLFFLRRKKRSEIFQNMDASAAVIIEPRKHDKLGFVCDLVDARLDPSWDMYVFHGLSAGDFARNATRNITRRKIHFIPLHADNFTADDYNAFMKTDKMWDVINAENILVFQTDSVLCDKSPFKIEDFIKFDYVGCPVNLEGATGSGPDHKKFPFYGIGGLSFRKKSFWKRCVADENREDIFPEDVLASICVDKHSNPKPNPREMHQFCSQYSFYPDIPSFGIHKPTPSNKNEMIDYCPASAQI